MRYPRVLILAAVLSIAVTGRLSFVAAQSSASNGPKSVRDGLFTDTQAARGKVAYDSVCAECHMRDLAGREYAGPLAGWGFQLKWQDASLGELYGRIRSMPLGRPGSLSSQEYVDILAYVLQQNTYPAGASELTGALAAQRWPRIVIERVVERAP